MSNQSKFNGKYHQGYYQLINKDKYLGDPTRIVYRSSWELAFCRYLDNNTSIVKWSCETLTIQYRDLENKSHRYYPDFYYVLKDPNDPMKQEQVIVEIKPLTEVNQPNRPLNETSKALRNYEYAIRTHIKNKLKWSAAIDYCNKRGMKFILVTENHLKKYGILQ